MGLFEEIRTKKKGGGTRHLRALKCFTMAELLECGKEMFFPNDRNKLGNVFEFTMCDFTEEEIAPSTTLGQQYEMRKVRMLRLYPSCKRIETDDILANMENVEDVPDTHFEDAQLVRQEDVETKCGWKPNIQFL